MNPTDLENSGVGTFGLQLCAELADALEPQGLSRTKWVSTSPRGCPLLEWNLCKVWLEPSEVFIIQRSDLKIDLFVYGVFLVC